MTFEIILHFIKKFYFHNVSIHLNFYQNRLINECNSLNINVKCRRTYVLDNFSESICTTTKINKVCFPQIVPIKYLFSINM